MSSEIYYFQCLHINQFLPILKYIYSKFRLSAGIKIASFPFKTAPKCCKIIARFTYIEHEIFKAPRHRQVNGNGLVVTISTY